MSNIKTAAYAALWLSDFFECDIQTFTGDDVPIGTEVSVIALPYGERWRVRIAFDHDGFVYVEVSHCPTGERTLVKSYSNWRDSIQAIAEAVRYKPAYV